MYHVLNRANGRAALFHNDSDYEAFERVIEQAHAWLPLRLLAYCIMPNHWHMVIHPREDGELSEFMRWLSVTHAQRLHAYRGTAGHGHVYQGRFKSFPIQRDEHFLVACRYVERNALRAGLVRSAENWRWSSLWRFAQGAKQNWILSVWPVDRPRGWVSEVNRPQSEAEEEAVRNSIRRPALWAGHRGGRGRRSDWDWNGRFAREADRGCELRRNEPTGIGADRTPHQRLPSPFT